MAYAEQEYHRQSHSYTKNQIRHIMRDDERLDETIKSRPAFNTRSSPSPNASINVKKKRNLWDEQEPAYLRSPSPFRASAGGGGAAAPPTAPAPASVKKGKGGAAAAAPKRPASGFSLRDFAWDMFWLLPLALGAFEYVWWQVDLGEALPDHVAQLLGKNKFFAFVHATSVPHLASAYAHHAGCRWNLLVYLPYLACYSAALVQPAHTEAVSALLAHMGSRGFRAMGKDHWQAVAARFAHSALSVVDMRKVELDSVWNLFRLGTVALILMASFLVLVLGKARRPPARPPLPAAPAPAKPPTPMKSGGGYSTPSKSPANRRAAT